VSALIFTFAFTSTASTYVVGASHAIASAMGSALKRVGVRDLDSGAAEEAEHGGKGVVLVGFYREASALVHEFERVESDGGRHPILDDLLVIDFNPEVHRELNRRGIACVYGDVAHMDTLHHAHVHDANLVVSTIPDAILKGTDNLRLLRQARRLSPHAKVIVTAERVGQAIELYAAGADFVYVPRLHSARDLARAIEDGLRHGFDAAREEHLAELNRRDEVLA
jgi:hypothetical protein